MRNAILLDSPGADIVAHVDPEKTVSQQELDFSDKPEMHVFGEFGQQACVPDCIIRCAVRSRKTAPVFRFYWYPFSINVVRTDTWSHAHLCCGFFETRPGPGPGSEWFRRSGRCDTIMTTVEVFVEIFEFAKNGSQ